MYRCTALGVAQRGASLLFSCNTETGIPHTTLGTVTPTERAEVTNTALPITHALNPYTAFHELCVATVQGRATTTVPRGIILVQRTLGQRKSGLYVLRPGIVKICKINQVSTAKNAIRNRPPRSPYTEKHTSMTASRPALRGIVPPPPAPPQAATRKLGRQWLLLVRKYTSIGTAWRIGGFSNESVIARSKCHT